MAVLAVVSSPFAPPEIGHPQPGFIHIQDCLSICHQLEKLQRELLAENEVLGRIRVRRNRNDLLELHLQHLLHDVFDLFLAGYNLLIFLKSILDRLSRVEEFAFIVPLVHQLCNSLFLCVVISELKVKFFQHLRLLLDFPNEKVDDLHADPIFFGDFLEQCFLNEDFECNINLIFDR